MRMHSRNASPARRRSLGFTLVELMVSLVLGLIVTGAALAMFMTNQRVYTTTESLGRVQENVRTAYELMARDMREVAGTPCEADLPVVNILNSPNSRWWSTLDGRVRGFDGATAFSSVYTGDEAFSTAAGVRLAGTDAIELRSMVSEATALAANQASTSPQFTLQTAAHGLTAGDLVMVCDFNHAAVFQINSVAGDKIGYGTSGTPGNCTTGLGFSNPANCTGGGLVYPFQGNTTIQPQGNAIMARLRMARWYIANNSRGGRSLYQTIVVNNAGTLGPFKQEIADGVQNMRLQYLVQGATTYVDAGSVNAADWNTARILAVRVILTVRDRANASANADVVDRTLEHTVTLRNRVP